MEHSDKIDNQNQNENVGAKGNIEPMDVVNDNISLKGDNNNIIKSKNYLLNII